MTGDGRQLISITQAAEYLGLSKITVRRYIAAGKLTGYRAGPKMIRLDRRQVDELLRPIGPQ